MLKLIGNNMKIFFIKNKHFKWVKKHTFQIMIIILLVSLLYEAYFLYSHVKSKPVNQSEITAKENKINQKKYQEVIDNHNLKKSVDYSSIDQLNNPF